MNYFEYFTEIEERFTARRGSLLLLSTLDWALIETWREAGVPLVAVLRGIDAAFDKYDARKARSKGRLGKVNGLAWCAQAVMEAAAEITEASIGGHPAAEAAAPRETGFEAERVRSYLHHNADLLQRGADGADSSLREALIAAATRLEELEAELKTAAPPPLDELDRRLTVIEERLQASLLSSVPEADLLAAREKADRDLAALRGLGAVQRRQVREQYMQKQLFAERRLPRLSLFYMPVVDDADGGTV